MIDDRQMATIRLTAQPVLPLDPVGLHEVPHEVILFLACNGHQVTAFEQGTVLKGYFFCQMALLVYA